MLTTEHLTKKFGGVVAVDDLSFEIAPAEVLGLIGPNGSGKTTVLNLITGFTGPSSGKVLLEGKDITGKSPHALAKLGIVRTFQSTTLFAHMTVLESVRIGAHLHGGASDDGDIDAILGELDLSKYHDFDASSLPYGVQRRVEIAIALAARPRLLLLDEPAAGMNPEESEELVGQLKRILARKITIILVDHNMRFVTHICNRILVLNHGHKIGEGLPEDVLRLPQVVDIYLGKRRYA
jgi:ABC-type branched-subunit amino acid transport system ATPase component